MSARRKLCLGNLSWKTSCEKPLDLTKLWRRYIIKMDIRQITCTGIEWVYVAEDKRTLEATCEYYHKIWVSMKSEKQFHHFPIDLLVS